MKKGMRIVGIIAALCALFTGCARRNVRTQKTDCSSGLVSCTYVSSGGMEGGHVYLKLSREGDSWVLQREKQDNHMEEEKVERYAVPESAARGLEEFFSWHDCENWKNLSVNEDMIALDAPTDSISFELADGRSFSAKDVLDLPEEEIGLCSSVSWYLHSYTVEVELCELDAKGSGEIVFSKPEMVDCTREERPGGAVYILRGRIPGELTAELRTDEKSRPARVHLKVDSKCRVTVEQR